MNPGSIFFGLALLFVAALFVMNPLINAYKYKKGEPTQKPEAVNSKAEYKAVLKSLSDLDFDFQSGKINQEDYANLRGQLVTEASKYVQATPEIEKTGVDDAIEELIQARKAALQNVHICKKCGHALHQGDRFCPGCGEVVQAFCPKCGHEVSGDDEFCSSCGTPLGSLGYKFAKKGSVA